MFKKRFFSGDFGEKLDRLLHYLFKMKYEYTFHVMDKKDSKDLIYIVSWFEPARLVD